MFPFASASRISSLVKRISSDILRDTTHEIRDTDAIGLESHKQQLLQSRRLIFAVAVLAVTLAGAAVRLSGLGADSFDLSEIDEVNRAEAIRFPRDHAWRPVASLSTWVTAAALGRDYGEATLRFANAAAGSATILAVCALGVLSFGAEAGFYAAVALAAAPLHVTLSRRLGDDAWLTLCVTLMALVCIWALREPRDVRRRLVFAASALLACGCAYRGLLVLAALTVALALAAVRRPALRRLAALAGCVTVMVAAAAAVMAAYQPPPLNGGWLRPDFSWPFPLRLMSESATGQPQRLWAGGILFASVLMGLVASASTVPGIIAAAWLLIGTAGLLCVEWFWRVTFRPTDVGFVLPAYLLFGAAGLARLRQAVCSRRVPPLVLGGGAAALILLLAVELPGLAELRVQHHPSWRLAARVVDANIRPDDVLVVLAEQPAFAFYAPELEPRMPSDVRPARAPAYFVHPKRGWLVAPERLRQGAAWKPMQQWLTRFPPVDLSPDDTAAVLYMGQGGYEQLLIEAAHFTLPTRTLVHGTLLLDWLQQIGPVPAVLWKVDQIALSKEPLELHNASLLEAVYYLARHDHGDRAASLAYRLATAQPRWDEARRALEAFEPSR